MSHIAPSGKETYLDYAAFSPTDEGVLSAMQPYYEASYGNPSSLHLPGRRAKKELEVARERIASTLLVEKEEIIFTSGGTESNNLAIIGIARANRSKGNHVIVSAIEHPSVLQAAKRLEEEGFDVSFAPVLANGTLDIDACMGLVTRKTVLVSVMYVNNETGTIQPVGELSKRLADLPENVRPFLHTDACQAGNVLPLSPCALGVDLMTVNSTKLSGPAGIGLLYRKRGINLEPMLVGGEQEGRSRAGTESVPLAVGFSLALSKAQRNCNEERVRLEGLRSYFVNGLRNRIPSIQIQGDERAQSPAIVHVTVPRIEGEAMLLLLDHYGIHASTGSACASLQLSASHVLTAMGHDVNTIHGSLRFSFGRKTAKEDLDRVLECLPLVTERLCSMTAIKEKKYER